MSLAAGYAADPLPVALVFPTTVGEGSVAAQAKEATTAIKYYLRETGKLETMTFDPESSVIRRAIEEKKLKLEEVTGKIGPETRLNIGKQLGVDYVLSADISYDAKMKVNLWMARVASRQVWGFEGEAEVAKSSNKGVAISNSIQAATNRVVLAAADTALKDVKPLPAPTEIELPKVEDDATTPPPAEEAAPVKPETPEETAQNHIALAQAYVNSGDVASAILEYRRAIDAVPKKIETRVKLAELYTSRQMFSQAQDELTRAQEIAPDSELVKAEIEKLKAAMTTAAEGQPQTSKPAEETGKTPKPAVRGGIASSIAAGDQAWRAQRLDEAERYYRIAVAADPGSIVAIERLSLLLLALGRFDAVKAEVDRIHQLEPSPDPKVDAERYARLISYVVRHIRAFVGEYDSLALEFANHSITREAYYQKAQSLSTRIAAMVRLNDSLIPPEAMAKEYRHQSLGLSLMSQACTHLIAYLESNKQSDRDNASMMMTEARKHMLGVGK
jgi:tetratricopeptide (TPR) repeat protein